MAIKIKSDCVSAIVSNCEILSEAAPEGLFCRNYRPQDGLSLSSQSKLPHTAALIFSRKR